MKVFFLASINVDENTRKCYETIIKILQSGGHKVVAQQAFELPENIKKLSSKENEKRAKLLLKEMLLCDCVVFEGAKPSTGGGYYLYAALQRSLPVLYLVQTEYEGLYLASSNRLLRIKQYDRQDTNNLTKIINDFVKFSNKKRLSNRFNLMISDTMNEFLGKISNDHGISKADFIRDLIYKEMEKD